MPFTLVFSLAPRTVRFPPLNLVRDNVGRGDDSIQSGRLLPLRIELRVRTPRMVQVTEETDST